MGSFIITFNYFFIHLFMDKASILNALTSSGDVSTFRRSANWDKAFELYNKTTGQHKHQNCGTCYREVLAWLRN